MTVALAEELKGAGILVNEIAPSTLDTPHNRAAMPKADARSATRNHHDSFSVHRLQPSDVPN